MEKKKRFTLPRKPRVIEKCFFCVGPLNPDYKEPEVLRKFITERGKISGREWTGICAKHQRKLTVQIKRARFLALLPFVNQIK